MKLTQRILNSLPAGRHTDDQCKSLHLFVTRTGGRSWIQRLNVNGKRVDRGLGSAEFVSLKEARETASRNRHVARRGGDPFTAKVEAPTFAAAAAAFTATLGALSPTTAKTYASTINILRRLHDRPIADITRAEVIAVLKAVDSVSSRSKALKIAKRIFDVATINEWRTDNPADNGGIAKIVGIHAERPSHHASAAPADCPRIYRAAAAVGSAAGDALALILCTATRLSEATGAAWDEIDLDAKVWTIPAARMKAKREHRIPLSDAAVSILERRVGRHEALVFGTPTGRTPSQHMVSKVAKAAGADTVHGLRGSFRTWVAANGLDREAAEHALAHVVGNSTERCYQHDDLLDRRAELMNAWAAYLAG